MILHVAADAAEPFDVQLRSEPLALAWVRPALRRLAAHAGLDAERTMALLVASGEAMANAVLHAYPDGRGAIKVSARRADGGLLIEVTDHGRWRESRRALRSRGGSASRRRPRTPRRP